MPQDFSHEDFSKMQQQAINRVREMQRQSKAKEPKEKQQSGILQDEEKSERFFEKDVQNRPQPERIFKPLSSPPPITRVNTGRKKTVSSFLEMDSDIALILPLLLLLQRDGADEMLILALLYIMA